MSERGNVILSGFTDEAASQKTIDQQFSVAAAAGLSHFALRFIDAGNGIKNVSQLSDSEVAVVRGKMAEFGLRISSIGSPIGKVKLFEFDDGSTNRSIEPATYLREDVARVCELADAFEVKLVRGFSFYPPRGANPEEFLDQAIERLTEIVLACDRRGLTFGLEVEANLVGCTGNLLSEIHRQIDHPALVLVFDGANLSVQGLSAEQIFEQYLAMKPGLGWLHVKDYRNPVSAARAIAGATPRVHPTVDEDRLTHFVPVGLGDSAYAKVFSDLAAFLPTLHERMARRGAEGVVLELEPHLKAGGQFGGFSGADGFGVALRALTDLLEQTGIGYRLRDWEQLDASKR
jgi:sugar phosphate isomerase/epimerase